MWPGNEKTTPQDPVLGALAFKNKPEQEASRAHVKEEERQ